jgi:hypothetical protein
MKQFFLYLIVSAVLISCSKDNNDTIDTPADIIDFSVNATTEFTPKQVNIDKTNSHIYIFSETSIDNAVFPISITPDIQISEGASITPNSGIAVNFSDREDFAQYTLTSASGKSSSEWVATIRDKQIPNSDFENWHKLTGMNSLEFDQPGKHAENTVWSTANMGTSLFGIYGTIPIELNSNTMVKIQTGKTTTVPVTAGTLFLGKFDLEGAIQNPTDPKKATDFGVPFIYRPSAIKLLYKYKSGDHLIQATLKDPSSLFGGFTIDSLSGKDEFNIYATLEVRNDDGVKEIARAELKGDDTDVVLTEISLPFVYTSDETPTHISIVFTSSAYGDLWKGAVGSELIIDDLELIYD